MRTEVFQAGDGRFNTSSVPVDVSIFQPEGKCSLMQTALRLRHSNGKHFYNQSISWNERRRPTVTCCIICC